MRFLVGYDGSEGSRDALELARGVAEARGAGVVVVTVVVCGPLPMQYAVLDEEQEQQAEPLFAEATQRLGGDLEVETRAFGGGTPAGVINDLAERESFKSIVVGSPHRGPVGRTLLGSVANGLLHGAPCDVIVAPRGYASETRWPIRTVAVAYDGTAEAKVALNRAEAIALASQARIVIYTTAMPAVFAAGMARYVPPMSPDAGTIVTRAVKAVDERLAATGRALGGDPGLSIIEACEEVGADLLVAGSRGYGPTMRVMLGSVSTKLAQRAPCPVLVVPRPER